MKLRSDRENMMKYIENLNILPIREVNEDDIDMKVKLNMIMIECLKECYDKSEIEAMNLKSTNKKLLKKKLRKK